MGFYPRSGHRGVDLIQNCEVTGFRIEDGKVRGVETTRGFIGADKVGVAAAGNTSRVMHMAGLATQRKSCSGLRVRRAKTQQRHYVRCRTLLHQSVRQRRAGVRWRHRRLQQLRPTRQFATVEDVCEVGMALMPMIGRRGCSGLGAAWTGDGRLAHYRQNPDWRFVLERRLVLRRLGDARVGWCFAHLIATGEPHPVATAYRLDRFETGHVIDERARAPNQLH